MSSSPSRARPFIINKSSRTRISSIGGLPLKGLRRHRPEDRLFHVSSLRRVHTLGTTECTPPLARLRLWPSAPTGSASLWGLTASVERCWLLGSLWPRSRRSAMTPPYLPGQGSVLFEMGGGLGQPKLSEEVYLHQCEASFHPGEQGCQSCSGWSCVHDARHRQWWESWAHHRFVPQVSSHCWKS